MREDISEARGVDQRPVGGPRGITDHVTQGREALRSVGVAGLDLGGPGKQNGRGQSLQVALRDGGVGVPGEHDLALLGHLEATGDGSRGLRGDGTMQWPAAAPQGAASAVEQREVQGMAARPRDQLGLGIGQGQRCGRRPHILRRVGVAEHHFDVAVHLVQPLFGRGQGQPGLQDLTGRCQVGTGLEQGHDVQPKRRIAYRQPGKGAHCHQVRCRLRERHDVATARAGSPAALQPRHDPQGVQHLTRLWRLGAHQIRPPLASQLFQVPGIVGEQLGVGDARQLTDQFHQCRAVHRRVLSYLEFGKVEPERLGVPDDVLQFPVGRSPCPRIGQ